MGVHVIGTGGTIASLTDPATGAVTPAVAIADLVASLPGMEALGDVSAEEVSRVNGWNVTPAVMNEVSHGRVMIELMPSCARLSCTRRVMARFGIFSGTPDGATAPVSGPPCPGSSTTST